MQHNETYTTFPADVQEILRDSRSNVLRSLGSFFNQIKSLMQAQQKDVERSEFETEVEVEGAEDAQAEEAEEDVTVEFESFEEITRKSQEIVIPASFKKQWKLLYRTERIGDPAMDCRQLDEIKDSFIKSFSQKWEEIVESFAQVYASSASHPDDASGGFKFSLVDHDEMEKKLSEKSLMPNYESDQRCNLIPIRSGLRQAMPDVEIDEGSLPFLPLGLVRCILYAIEQVNLSESLELMIKSQISELLLPKINVIYSSIHHGLKVKGYQLESSEVHDAKVRRAKERGNAGASGMANLSGRIASLLAKSDTLENLSNMVSSSTYGVQLNQIMDEMPGNAKPVSFTNEQAERLLSSYQTSREQSGVSLQEFLAENISVDENSNEYQIFSRKQVNFVNLISLLFEFIHQESGIIAEMEYQIMRLQIPYMRLAMKDDTVLQTVDHPARSLLNKFADVAPIIESEEDEHLEPIIKLVDQIASSDDLPQKLFEDVFRDLEVIENKINEAALEKHRKIKEKAEQEALEAEYELNAEIAVREIVQERINGLNKPLIFHQLLKYFWSLIIKSVYTKFHGLSEERTGAVELFESILWSTGYGLSPLNKKQLLSALPKMVSNIEKTLRDNALDPMATEFFFDQLREIHLKVIKGDRLTNIVIEDSDLSGAEKAKEIVAQLHAESQRKIQQEKMKQKELEQKAKEMGVGHYYDPEVAANDPEPTVSDPESTQSELESSERELEPSERELEPSERELEPSERELEPSERELEPAESELEFTMIDPEFAVYTVSNPELISIEPKPTAIVPKPTAIEPAFSFGPSSNISESEEVQAMQFDVQDTAPQPKQREAESFAREESNIKTSVTMSELDAKRLLVSLTSDDWFLYRVQNEFKRYKPVLLTPSLKNFTFVDASGMHEFKISRGDLLVDLQQGYAKVIERGNSFDRALEHFIGRMQEKSPDLPEFDQAS